MSLLDITTVETWMQFSFLETQLKLVKLSSSFISFLIFVFFFFGWVVSLRELITAPVLSKFSRQL